MPLCRATKEQLPAVGVELGLLSIGGVAIRPVFCRSFRSFHGNFCLEQVIHYCIWLLSHEKHANKFWQSNIGLYKVLGFLS